MPAQWPPDLTMKADMPAMFDNDGGDKVTIVGRARFAGIINSVEYIPNWTMTGAATNNRTFTLFNRGSAGIGTVTVAQLLMTAGASMTKFSAVSLSITTSAAAISVGDILEWESLHVGAGLGDPGGQVIVQQSLNP